MPQPTPQQTIGPFFPRDFFSSADSDLTRISPDAAPAAGQHVILHGVVTREGGEPCVNAILEMWQADAGGRFRHPADPQAAQADPDFLGWGRAWTDAQGRYAFRTVIPGGFADGTGTRAPHAQVTIMGAGLMRRVLATLWFPGDAAALAADPLLASLPAELRPRVTAREDGMVDGLRALRFDIRLRGTADEETPFFEE